MLYRIRQFASSSFKKKFWSTFFYTCFIKKLKFRKCSKLCLIFLEKNCSKFFPCLTCSNVWKQLKGYTLQIKEKDCFIPTSLDSVYIGFKPKCQKLQKLLEVVVLGRFKLFFIQALSLRRKLAFRNLEFSKMVLCFLLLHGNLRSKRIIKK